MGCVVEDQSLGFFARPSCLSACWCLVPHGEPHIDLPRFSLCCWTCHDGLPSLSLTGWKQAPSCATQTPPSIPSPPQPAPHVLHVQVLVFHLTNVKGVRSSCPLFVSHRAKPIVVRPTLAKPTLAKPTLTKPTFSKVKMFEINCLDFLKLFFFDF